MERGEIRIKNETLAELKPYTLTRGVPLPPGRVRSASGFSVVDARGRVLPAAGSVLQRRPDGSIEWLLMDVQLQLEGHGETSVFVVPKAAKPAAVRHPVVLRKEGSRTVLANGLSEVVVNRAGGSLFEKLTLNGRNLLAPGACVDLETVDAGGKIHRASLSGAYRVRVLHRNSLRTTVAIEGKHKARDGATFMDFTLRVTLCAGTPDVKLEHTFYCREPRDGKIAVRAMRLVMPTSMPGEAEKLVRQTTRGYDNVYHDLAVKENAEIIASATGNLDQYKDPGAGVAHQAAGGAVFLRNPDSFHENWSEYPFHMRLGSDPASGHGTTVSPCAGSFLWSAGARRIIHW
jgi:hypothetical protein